MRIRRPFLVCSVCAVVGFALGGATVGLWVQHTKSDWVEAYGTWFGSIATVAALLWAVQTFRADQRNRQEQIDGARAAEDASRLETASKVSIALRGGGGFGHPGTKQMNSVHVKIDNDSPGVVIVYRVELDPRLEALDLTQETVRIAPHTRWSQLVSIEDIAMPDEAFSEGPLPGYEGTIEYMAAGRDWERKGTRSPVAVGLSLDGAGGR